MERHLRVRSLLFARGSLDRRGCIPVRASRFAPVPDVDWFRGDASLASGALAFPVGLGQDTLRLRAEFEVIEAFPRPLRLRAVPRGSHLLGQVSETPVGEAAEGDILVTELRLGGHKLAGAAVGAHQVVWTWQHSQDGQSWVDFDETAHPVFTLLDHPAPPWGGPADRGTVVPWLETMKVACGWAKGARDPKTALDRITTRVSALGGEGGLEYGGGPSVTSGMTFFISDFMKAAKGDPDGPGAMNCVDLASAIAVLSAQLGCRSRSLRLLPRKDDGRDQLETNPILLFGNAGRTEEKFFLHEVVRLGDEPVVWDACVSVDFDARPDERPSDFGLPTGIGLDGDREPGGHGYRARLLQPSDRKCRMTDPACKGIRYPDAVPAGVCGKREPSERGRRRYYYGGMRGMPWSKPSPGAQDGYKAWLESVTLDHAFGRSVSNPSGTLKFIPIRPPDAEGAGAEISLLGPLERPRAVDLVLGLLTGYVHALRRAPNLGDYAVYGRRDETVYLLRGGVIAVIRGGAEGSALKAAKDLDDELKGFFAVSS